MRGGILSACALRFRAERVVVRGFLAEVARFAVGGASVGVCVEGAGASTFS